MSEELQKLKEIEEGKSRLEKSLEHIIKGKEKNYDISSNYYGPAVDIFDGNYGKVCQVTFLMKDSFSGTDSDNLHELGKLIRGKIRNILPDFFNGGISHSVSTIQVYVNYEDYYNKMKKGEDD